MQQININIKNRRAQAVGSPVLICNNTYSVSFSFDDEWAGAPVKTARFVYAQGCQVKHQDVVFDGDTVEMPKRSGVRDVRVGVYAGDLITTTPAWVKFKPSILCGSGTPDEPSEDVYSQIMALFNEKVLGSGTPIDQVFDPESENPQSGRAVAEAIVDTLKRTDLAPEIAFDTDGNKIYNVKAINETLMVLSELITSLDERISAIEENPPSSGRNYGIMKPSAEEATIEATTVASIERGT